MGGRKRVSPPEALSASIAMFANMSEGGFFGGGTVRRCMMMAHGALLINYSSRMASAAN